ncbi:MAG: T9SS type A sorting domain-containing protein [Ignavibacteriae bacterium]|nr:T9SS type A sorting domain-containing protein [Ignavibacteriota bacterium]
MNNGGSVASITSFSLCPQRMLYCGTPGDGVWRYQFLICSAGDASNPTQAALMQNYPNPFNPTTTIRFTGPATVGTGPAGIALAGRHALSLRVYDVLGREVATLVNEVKQPGTYTVQWDASEVASGVYLYQLRAGGFVQTKKLMVLR